MGVVFFFSPIGKEVFFVVSAAVCYFALFIEAIVFVFYAPVSLSHIRQVLLPFFLSLVLLIISHFIVQFFFYFSYQFG